jgi:nicotinate-nucleotide pyrophosphorylase (carboxylating)
MNYLNHTQIKEIVAKALLEDIGKADITTGFVIPAGKRVKAVLLAKEDFVVCGLDIARAAFRQKDKNLSFVPLVKEGAAVKNGQRIARIEGNARSILIAERVALNFLSLLSGIAANTRRFVEAVRPFKVKIMDTRKTLPLLRGLEKYAIRAGGGYNHRMKLDEMILVKDNHLKIIGGYGGLAKLLRNTVRLREYKIELECESLEEFMQALILNPDIIMLDNMSIKDMKKAVMMRNRFSTSITYPRPALEASGGITLENVKDAASTGVEMVSIGALTHSVASVDISLEFL